LQELIQLINKNIRHLKIAYKVNFTLYFKSI